jgi:hypothetical protein
MDSFKGGRKVAVVLRKAVAWIGCWGPWKARHFVGVVLECRSTAVIVDEIILPRRPANKNW